MITCHKVRFWPEPWSRLWVIRVPLMKGAVIWHRSEGFKFLRDWD